MTSQSKIAHNVGRPRIVERQQPRRSRRETPNHADKYADQREDPTEREMAEKLAALVRHFHGEEADHA